MKKVLIFDDIVQPVRNYNHIVRAGDFLFVSTQIPMNLKTGTFVEGDVIVQAKQSLENVKILLEKAGSSLTDIVKIGIFLKNLEDFESMNVAYNSFFPDKKTAPTRFTLQTNFPDERIKIEFEATAYAPI